MLLKRMSGKDLVGSERRLEGCKGAHSVEQMFFIGSEVCVVCSQNPRRPVCLDWSEQTVEDGKVREITVSSSHKACRTF